MCASAIEFMTVVCLFSVMASMLSLGIGAFLYAIRATSDITANLKLINDSTRMKKNQDKILEYLSDFVQFHGNVKELSKFRDHFIFKSNETVSFSHIFILYSLLHTFLHVFQPIFMWIFLWSIISICGSLLMFQMHMVQHTVCFDGDFMENNFSVKSISVTPWIWTLAGDSIWSILCIRNGVCSLWVFLNNHWYLTKLKQKQTIYFDRIFRWTWRKINQSILGDQWHDRTI